MLQKNNSTEALSKGRSYQKEGNIKAAVKYYKLAVSEGEKLGHVFLAYLYYSELDELELALLHLKKVYPEYPQISYNIGFVYEKLSKYTEAVHYYKKAIKSEVAVAHIQLGYLYECFGNHDQAVMQYQIALFKGELQANLLLARLFEELGDLNQASDYYVAAMEADLSIFKKRCSEHVIPLGKTEKQWHTYQKQWQIEMKKGPLALGMLNEQIGQDLNALICYQKSLNQGDERALTMIEKLLFRYHNDQEKVILLQNAIKERVTEGYYYLALFHKEKKDYSNALIAIKKYNQKTHKKFPKGVDLLNTIFEQM